MSSLKLKRTLKIILLPKYVIIFIASMFMCTIYIFSITTSYNAAEIPNFLSVPDHKQIYSPFLCKKEPWVENYSPFLCKKEPWVEKWISTGTFGSSDSKNESKNESKKQGFCDKAQFDIVYTWVNGSEDNYKVMQETYVKKLNLRIPEHYYRDYDELRYSIRSVETFFKDYINKIYILVTDLENGTKQIPSWLNTTWINPRTEEPRVEIVKHTDVFTDNTVLPTFNSLAIESQMMNIPNLSDQLEQVIYFNDDLFLGRYLTPSDFWSPLYGHVFHIESQLVVPPDHDWLPIQPGEWYALRHTNKLLTYVSHSTHIFSTSILKEIAAEWSTEFHETSSHRFRGEQRDIHTNFLYTHYVIEKHRETLLKSFLIWKMDKNHNGHWELTERQEILKILGTDEVHRIERKSLSNYSKTLIDADLFHPYETTYSWTSMDGYPIWNSRPNLYDTKCIIDFDNCFGKDFMNNNTDSIPINKIFRTLAFDKYRCGDCIITRVLSLSGELGLEAFLPESPPIVEENNKLKDNNLTNDNLTNDNITNNNLTNNNLTNNNLTNNNLTNNNSSFQEEANFNYREHAVEQISRFNYVIGDISFEFVMLKQPYQSWLSLNNIMNKNPSIFCLNDDVEGNNPIIKKYVKKFLRLYFRQDNEYEIDGWERKKNLWRKFRESVFGQDTRF
ncbi:25698_t:CDS:2 [Dentiscutata erythropus]|uniref:25698_t:CDS:1 n=1 Tax=Dentiscutata erythropus TaxID=1348616 RepID=A0A9N8YZZ2_9GLOM|nr:25698_t:CDS:2 [Dentiscutata erythropus]